MNMCNGGTSFMSVCCLLCSFKLITRNCRIIKQLHYVKHLYLLKIRHYPDGTFPKHIKVVAPLIQVCGSVRSSEGLVSVSGILEFPAAQATNSPPHVLHQEPWPLRGRHAYAPRETHSAGLELLRILHGPGTLTEDWSSPRVLEDGNLMG